MPRIALLLMLVVLLSACSLWPQHHERLLPFTHALRAQYNLGPEELRQLNFYLAAPIKLRQQQHRDALQFQQGRLVSSTAKEIEEVLIKPGTPGVVLNVGEHWLDVSFAPGSFLRFGSSPKTRDSWHGRYALWATRWVDGIGELSGELAFEGRTFYAVDDSERTYLLLDTQHLQYIHKTRRVLDGRTIRQ